MIIRGFFCASGDPLFIEVLQKETLFVVSATRQIIESNLQYK